MGSLFVGSVFNPNSKFGGPIFGTIGSLSITPITTILIFFILNSIGIIKGKDHNRKKGTLYGYLFLLLPIILFLAVAFVVTGYH